MVLPQRVDIFPPLDRGSSRGLDASRFFLRHYYRILHIIATVLCCIVLWPINYVPQPNETKGQMRSDFSLDTYYYRTLLPLHYCTVLCCIAPY